MEISNTNSMMQMSSMQGVEGCRRPPPPPKDGQLPPGVDQAVSDLSQEDQTTVKSMFESMSETQHAEFKSILDSLTDTEKSYLSGDFIKETLASITQSTSENEVDIFV